MAKEFWDLCCIVFDPVLGTREKNAVEGEFIACSCDRASMTGTKHAIEIEPGSGRPLIVIIAVCSSNRSSLCRQLCWGHQRRPIAADRKSNRSLGRQQKARLAAGSRKIPTAIAVGVISLSAGQGRLHARPPTAASRRRMGFSPDLFTRGTRSVPVRDRP